jgi:HEAT repeat protein
MTNADTLNAIVAEPSEDRRWEVLRALVASDPSLARAVGEQGMASAHPRTREVAADVLGAVACVDPTSASAIADTLIPRLHVEHDASVLDSVITALGHAGDSRARAGVVKHADHPDERVRLAVAWSLPSLGLDEGSLAAMRRLSSDPEAQVRDWATFGLAESDARDAATTEALAARSADPHDDTRAEAILGLARRHDPGARRLIERERSLPIYGSLIDRALEELEA